MMSKKLSMPKSIIQTSIRNSRKVLGIELPYGYSAIYGPEWSAVEIGSFITFGTPGSIFALNAEGDPDLWHRKFMISGRQIMDLWPDAPFEDTFRLALKTDPYKEYVCIHAIFPRDERDITKITAENKPYASVYMLDGQKTVLEESGWTLARFRLSRDGERRMRRILDPPRLTLFSR